MHRRKFIKNVVGTSIGSAVIGLEFATQSVKASEYNVYSTPCLDLYEKILIPDGKIAEYPAELYFPNGSVIQTIARHKKPHRYLLESNDYIDIPTYETIEKSEQEVLDKLEFSALQNIMAAAWDRNIIINGNNTFHAISNALKTKSMLCVDYFISNKIGQHRYGMTNIRIPENIWKKILSSLNIDDFDYKKNNLGIVVNSTHRALVSPVRVEMTKISEGWMSDRGLACLNSNCVCLVSFD